MHDHETLIPSLLNSSYPIQSLLIQGESVIQKGNFFYMIVRHQALDLSDDIFGRMKPGGSTEGIVVAKCAFVRATSAGYHAGNRKFSERADWRFVKSNIRGKLTGRERDSIQFLNNPAPELKQRVSPLK